MIGKPKHGFVLGMELGGKVPYVFGYSTDNGCSKRCQEEHMKEKEKTEALFKKKNAR
ncbi:hypothetical protein LINPERPRIM_LOCUS30082 [Linum perenne]